MDGVSPHHHNSGTLQDKWLRQKTPAAIDPPPPPPFHQVYNFDMTEPKSQPVRSQKGPVRSCSSCLSEGRLGDERQKQTSWGVTWDPLVLIVERKSWNSPSQSSDPNCFSLRPWEEMTFMNYSVFHKPRSMRTTASYLQMSFQTGRLNLRTFCIESWSQSGK